VRRIYKRRTAVRLTRVDEKDTHYDVHYAERGICRRGADFVHEYSLRTPSAPSLGQL
jgi:hypothetical protein